MAINVAVDERLLNQALKAGKRSTKRETVAEALREYIARREQARLLALFGTVDYEPGYDYKRQRGPR